MHGMVGIRVKVFQGGLGGGEVGVRVTATMAEGTPDDSACKVGPQGELPLV